MPAVEHERQPGSHAAVHAEAVFEHVGHGGFVDGGVVEMPGHLGSASMAGPAVDYESTAIGQREFDFDLGGVGSDADAALGVDARMVPEDCPCEAQHE